MVTLPEDVSAMVNTMRSPSLNAHQQLYNFVHMHHICDDAYFEIFRLANYLDFNQMHIYTVNLQQVQIIR